MKYSRIIIILLLLPFGLFAQQLRLEDKLRISEAITISNLYGENIWNGFNKVPFTILLVTDDFEYLINHPYPSDDFSLIGHDSVLNSDIYYRKTKFNKHFLATFPAINGVNCIVVGTPENTNKNSSEWIITLIHEHFHQYVNTSTNYFKDVNGLNLAKGDTSGMWMLNYAFPYENEKTIKAYNKYVTALKKLLLRDNKGNVSTSKDFKHFTNKRNQFRKAISKDDYNYFSFQLWNEGIARYTEIKFLELMSSYKASPSVAKLDDFVPFQDLYRQMLLKETNNVTALNLNEEKRVCFYAVGMAEGLFLDKINPEWRKAYLQEKFYLEKYQKK